MTTGSDYRPLTNRQEELPTISISGRSIHFFLFLLCQDQTTPLFKVIKLPIWLRSFCRPVPQFVKWKIGPKKCEV